MAYFNDVFRPYPGVLLLILAGCGEQIAPPLDVQGAIASIEQVNQFATGYRGGSAGGPALPVPSTDPAGIVYHPPTGHLFIVDPEIYEISAVFGEVLANVFEISLTGDTLYNRFDVTTEEKGKTREPTGIAYCPSDNRFYTSHDDIPTGVWRYRLEDDDLHFEDQVTTPRGRDRSTSTNDDPEDIACDPATGLLYVLNGKNAEVMVYSYSEDYSESNPGPESRVATTHFKLQRTFEIARTIEDPSNIPRDPEGITIDPRSGHLFITSASDKAIFEFTQAGTFVEKFSISSFSPSPIAPQGITIAPSSDGSENESFYIVDGGIDNSTNADERDGRVYEAVINRTE